MKRNGEQEFHVTVTRHDVEMRDKHNTDTVVGVEINEDHIVLVAITEGSITDSIVLEFPEIKKARHQFFTMRKRMQTTS